MLKLKLIENDLLFINVGFFSSLSPTNINLTVSGNCKLTYKGVEYNKESFYERFKNDEEFSKYDLLSFIDPQNPTLRDMCDNHPPYEIIKDVVKLKSYNPESIELLILEANLNDEIDSIYADGKYNYDYKSVGEIFSQKEYFINHIISKNDILTYCTSLDYDNEFKFVVNDEDETIDISLFVISKSKHFHILSSKEIYRNFEIYDAGLFNMYFSKNKFLKHLTIKESLEFKHISISK